MNITYSLFPKFYSKLSLGELAALVKEAGLDTVNLVIRDRYWVTLDNIEKGTKKFVKTMELEGITVNFATASFSAEFLTKNDTLLAILADNGIKEFRIGYFQWNNKNVLDSLSEAKVQMERLARICEKNNIRAVYQVHHRTLIPHSLSAWQIIKDLPHQWIGVMLDPGNQTFEGKENWAMAVSLLGKYLVSLGIKDVKYEWDEKEKDSPSKGWKGVWVPAYEGVINWYDIKKVLSESKFEGTFVFMPFYHTESPEIMTKKLREEVRYIRAIMKGE